MTLYENKSANVDENSTCQGKDNMKKVLIKGKERESGS